MRRTFSVLDNMICQIDTALRSVLIPKHRTSARPTPGQELPESVVSLNEKRHVAGLMRVNHAGEVCAQALYQGQALTARLTTVKEQMTQAALEEVEHLAWCEQRLQELNSHPSVLNIVWYSGSLLLGALAGLAGDKWSLGFVAETERQVSKHLQQHLERLPLEDVKSRAILTMMHHDEASHAEQAEAAGAAELPFCIKQSMRLVSKIMTQSSYYI